MAEAPRCTGHRTLRRCPDEQTEGDLCNACELAGEPEDQSNGDRGLSDRNEVGEDVARGAIRWIQRWNQGFSQAGWPAAPS